MSIVTEHPELKRPVRADDWESLAVGTSTRLLEAIERGSHGERADLARFFLTEAEIIYDIYTQWIADTRRYLRDKGIAQEHLRAEEERLFVLSRRGRPDIVADREKTRDELRRLSELVATSSQTTRRLGDDARRLKDLWRHLHDADVDFISGLFDLVMRTFGEAALGEMYEGWVIGDWFDQRYKRFDVSRFDWEQSFPLIVYLTFESMHGHLAGPGRLGDVTFESYDDRVVFTFAPCGSGGRTVVGEPLDGTPPRMQPPYDFKVMEEEHPFAWNKKGVCTYCVHCCILTEKLPIESFGYPVRVVDPPVYPNEGDAVCRWTVYRDPRCVPESVYERVGSTKPSLDLPLGSEGKAQRDRADLSGHE